jgi:hypothetical protein
MMWGKTHQRCNADNYRHAEIFSSSGKGVLRPENGRGGSVIYHNLSVTFNEQRLIAFLELQPSADFYRNGHLAVRAV